MPVGPQREDHAPRLIILQGGCRVAGSSVCFAGILSTLLKSKSLFELGIQEGLARSLVFVFAGIHPQNWGSHVLRKSSLVVWIGACGG